MQHLVTDQADAIAAEARLAQRRLGSLNWSMPVELDHALAFAAADQHVEALHRRRLSASARSPSACESAASRLLEAACKQS